MQKLCEVGNQVLLEEAHRGERLMGSSEAEEEAGPWRGRFDVESDDMMHFCFPSSFSGCCVESRVEHRTE